MTMMMTIFLALVLSLGLIGVSVHQAYAEEDPPGREKAIDNACKIGKNPNCGGDIANDFPNFPDRETGINTGIFD